MKIALVSLAAAAAALVAAAPASATAYTLGSFSAPATVAVDRGGNNYIGTNGANTDTYSFTLLNAASLTTSLLGNSSAGGVGAFDFTTVFITGGSLVGQANYVVTPRGSSGSTTATMSPITLLAGSYTLTVNGTVSGAPSLYTGNLSFAQSTAPEPATWGLMVLGFGAVGGALRTSRRKVVFA